MKYQIKYNYDTGDSLTTELGLIDYVELEFNDLNIAKDNIKRIEEHYKQYQSINSYPFKRNNKTNQEIFQENSEKDWFVKKLKPCYFTDNKKSYQVIDITEIDRYIKKVRKLGMFLMSFMQIIV